MRGGYRYLFLLTPHFSARSDFSSSHEEVNVVSVKPPRAPGYLVLRFSTFFEVSAENPELSNRGYIVDIYVTRDNSHPLLNHRLSASARHEQER